MLRQPTNKINYLYGRLSHEDELQGDINSIINQRKILTKYAEENRIIPYEFICDDGFSGADFERPAFWKMIEDVEADLHGHFRTLGARANTLSGLDRLKTMFDIFHPDGRERFAFDFSWLPKTGLSTKDFIAPTSFTFGDSRTFRMGNKIGAASFLQLLAPEVNDWLLADFLDLESSVIVNLHIRSIDQTEAVKMIKRKITALDGMKIAEQKRVVQGGWDMDILPSDLATYGGEAKNQLRDLQTRNERMFLTTFLVINLADTKQQLENDVFAAAGVAQQHNCALYRLDNQQEKALMSSLPLGVNHVPIQRGLKRS